MVTWMKTEDGEYQIGYFDDDGNLEYYDTVKLKGDLSDITPDGYEIRTGEAEDGAPILSFVSRPLDFLQDK